MTRARVFGRTLPSWPEVTNLIQTQTSGEDLLVDVCVIGAGIAGLTTAYMLAHEGRSVAVLEKGAIGGGNTGRTTAQASNALDDRYSELVRVHGEKKAQIAAQSHTAAIDMIEAIIRKENIECAFERIDGYLFSPPGDTSDVLEKELEATRRVGLTKVQKVDRAPFSNFDSGPSLLFPDQGQFDPLQYLAGLTEAIKRMGGKIYTGTPVESVEDAQPAKVRTRSGHTVTADAVVVATNSPINDRVTLHTKQAPYTSYVVAAEIPAGSVTKALYWDTLDPYHYVRVQPQLDSDTELLLIGGEDHKTGQADDAEARYAKLEAWGRERFPSMGGVTHSWSGQVYESLDGLAFIGLNLGDDAIYVVTGDSGMGMTHGTIAGMLLRDLIIGRENAWADVYDPSRKPVKAAGEFASEMINVAGQFTELATPGSGKPEDIPRGSGDVVGFGSAKRAVYCDDTGTLHAHSAICPHLGCVVSWNSGEGTWDCPCHGSRFDAYGKVLNGPAKADLKAVDK